MTAPVRAQVQECREKSVQNEWQLLPGLPNDIFLNHVVPKLTWREIYSLSPVSRGWCHSIRNREVYEARVRSHSTETFGLIRYSRTAEKSRWLSPEHLGYALYSLRDNTCYDLPPIPGYQRFPYYCQCVAVDGKVYVVGGYKDLRQSSNEGDALRGSKDVLQNSNEVYVLDLAGQGKWKQCASLKEGRRHFGCGVLDGKIYVFGGHLDCKTPSLGSEVYDPETDKWSPIRQMPSARSHCLVATAGAELVVNKGMVVDEEDIQFGGARRTSAEFWDVYNSVLDEWRVVRRNPRTIFTARGKLYAECEEDIHLYDAAENSLTRVHSLSLAGPVDLGHFEMESVGAVDDQIIGIARWSRLDEEDAPEFRGQIRGLVRTRGLGSETGEVVLQRVSFPLPSVDQYHDAAPSLIMGIIQV